MKVLHICRKRLSVWLRWATFVLVFDFATVGAQITVKTNNVSCDGKADGSAYIMLQTSIKGTFRYSIDGAKFQTVPAFTELEEGSYIATIKDIDSKCEYYKPFTIKGPDEFTVSIESSDGLIKTYDECKPAPEITLVANVSGGNDPYNYSWGKDNLQVSSSGMYEVEVTDSSGCRAHDAVYVLFIPILCSKDPNDIIGPKGVGPQKWVSKNARLDYTIRFENDPLFATAPAQVVRVKQVLDTNFNIYSLRLGSFGFANMTFKVPDNRTYYTERLNLMDSLGILVDVIAGIDVQKKEAFWIFTSIDPATGLQPSKASLGFLPINDSISHKGEGFVSYTIMPASHTVTRDSIRAIADIVFDNNEAIVTPKVFNLIDAAAPSSQISKVADTLVSGSPVILSVQGKDDKGGSGFKNYDVYLSKNGGESSLWRENIPKDSNVVLVPESGRYCLFALAKDSVNNAEKPKSKSDLCFLSRKLGHIALKMPISSQKICTGSILPIQWSSKEVSDVNIYFKSQESDYQLVAKSIAAKDSTFYWTLPDSLSDLGAYSIRLEDVSEKTIVSEYSGFFSIIKSKPATISSTTGNKICIGQATQLKLENEFEKYLWSTGEQSRNITVLNKGFYKVTTINAKGCVRTDSISLVAESVPSKPFATVNGDTSVCEGDSLVISAPIGYSYYKWNTGDVSQSITVKKTGSYAVSVRNGVVCHSVFSDIVHIVVNKIPSRPAIISANSKTNICQGDSIRLIGPDGYEKYEWSNGRYQQQIILKHTNKVALKVIDINGCAAVSDSVNVRENNLPSRPYITVSAASYCEGDTVYLSAPIGYKIYHWSNGESSENVKVTKTQNLQLVVVDSNDCASKVSDITSIQLYPLAAKPVLIYEQVHRFCQGDSILLEAPISTYYRWSTGAVSRTVYVRKSGAYTVSVSDINGCYSPPSDTLKLTQFEVNAGKDATAYRGLPVYGCVDLAATAVGGSAPYIFAWENGGNASTQKICPDASGHYKVTATSADGCVATDTVRVCVEDIACSLNEGELAVQVCDQKGTAFSTRCVAVQEVPALLTMGYVLGSCNSDNPCKEKPVNVVDVLMPEASSSVQPNPFSTSTAIHFSIPVDGHVVLKVYDLSGVEIAKLYEGYVQSKRQYVVNFVPSKGLPSGMYIYKLVSDNGSFLSDKLILNK